MISILQIQGSMRKAASKCSGSCNTGDLTYLPDRRCKTTSPSSSGLQPSASELRRDTGIDLDDDLSVIVAVRATGDKSREIDCFRAGGVMAALKPVLVSLLQCSSLAPSSARLRSAVVCTLSCVPSCICRSMRSRSSWKR